MGKKDTPIKVVTFKPKGSPFFIKAIGSSVNKDDNSYLDVSVRILNEVDKEIDAFMIGFEFFSVFNEYQDHTSGYSLSDIKPAKEHVSNWKSYLSEASIVGSVVAYPYKVRFKDGEVWKADINEIEKLLEESYHTKVNIIQEEKNKKNK
jgi:hypothetical protein